jgi:hypothetical protein
MTWDNHGFQRKNSEENQKGPTEVEKAKVWQVVTAGGRF